MMPRWLQYLVAAGAISWLALLIFVGFPFAMSKLVTAGEQPFSREQREYLTKAYPGGALTSPSEYRWCDGRVFVHFNSRGDSYHFNAPCWKVQ